MRVHLIKRQTIEDYAEQNAQSRSSFRIWLTTTRFADWNEPTDIQQTFSSADLLGKSSSRVVFDIGGNNYRMICKYFFGEKEIHLYVCWIGTHADYDALCKKNEQYKISKF
ncbi:MAG: type II toxin-antitoxin system HigB family toxin [Ginsengibacter sp.]